MSDSCEGDPEVHKEINERQGKEEAEEVATNLRVAKGCLIGFAVICTLFAATCVAILSGDEPEVPPIAIDEGAVLAEMQGNFGSGITRVQVSGRPSRVRVDVYTDLYPDRDVAEVALGMALIAVQSSAVHRAYPSATIDSYVWPVGEAFYMTRASATYVNGALKPPIDSYVSEGMR